MLIAWINDDGQLNYTDNMNVVPDEFRDKVVIFENLSLDDAKWLMIKGSQIYYVSDENERIEMKKQALEVFLKQLVRNILLQTDWVVVKCVELKKDFEELYPEVINERRRIRQLCDEFEERIRKARSLEELELLENEVRIRFSSYQGLGFERLVF